MQVHKDRARGEEREVPVTVLHISAVEGQCATSGCFADSRHGSKWCQRCSDVYHKRLSIAEAKNPAEAEAIKRGEIEIRATFTARVSTYIAYKTRWIISFIVGFVKGIFRGLKMRKNHSK